MRLSLPSLQARLREATTEPQGHRVWEAAVGSELTGFPPAYPRVCLLKLKAGEQKETQASEKEAIIPARILCHLPMGNHEWGGWNPMGV